MSTGRAASAVPQAGWLHAPVMAVAAAFGLGAWLGEGGAREALALLVLSGAVVVLVYLAPGGRCVRWALCAAGLALGTSAAMIERLEYESAPLRRWASVSSAQAPVLLSGRLARDPDAVDERWLLTLNVESAKLEGREAPLPGRARIYVEGSAARPRLIEGDSVRIWARLGLPRGRRNPGVFDSVAHLFRRGTHAVGSCKSAALIEPAPDSRGVGLVSIVARVRDAARSQLAAFLGSGPAAAVVRAMVLGDRAGLSDETEEAFRIAGTYHVLALSGAQVALVTGLLLGGLRWLRAPPALAALLAGAAVTLYAAFVGGDVPVARATVMAVALLLGMALGLRGQATNLLGLAGLALLTFRPSAIADASFQLSFAATLSIIWFVPLFTPALSRLPRSLALLLAASLAAQIGVLPLMAYHFHRLAPAALALNLIAVPAASAVLVAGFVVVLAAPWAPPLAWLAGRVAWLAAEAMLRSSAWAGSLPGLDVRVMTPTAWIMLVFVVALCAFALRPARRRFAAAVLALAALCLAFGVRAPLSDGRLHLTVLDVGGGDSLVLHSPRGRTLIVDTGGNRTGQGPDVGETVVAPYLWWSGVRSLDVLVLTHRHSDHTGGAAFLIRHFGVSELWGRAAIRREARLETGPLKPTPIARGFRRNWDGVEIEALWPPETAAVADLSENDASLVLVLRYGDVRFLLTGDVGNAAETGLHPGAIDVLKVAHHGSRHSSSEPFLDEVRPQVALVSSGAGAFGPHAETLARYRRRGVLLLGTAANGAVTAITDGRRLWVGPCEGPLSLVPGRALR